MIHRGLPAPAGTYEITAILQDNRENTVKVCASCACSFDACEAIIERIVEGDKSLTHEIVTETWSILYMSIRYIEE